jgi:hypothetical protein
MMEQVLYVKQFSQDLKMKMEQVQKKEVYGLFG